ncbi:GRB2-associated-binding protein 1-like isoform X1 [Haliotis asinina]|uniref:GRB2-associated-binding protein 1-like isoform X1 n=1 Tax=Haliotis asinina TaxID=109174 RepID=UPI003531AF08
MGQAKMNKIGNVVYSGWLIKSPPERKTTWKIFRAKWKRRFFVLFKPSGSLPGQYELSYFNDEHCSKKKGSIDLDQCEQIIESLDSDQFNYLLAIKTFCRGKERTYFLAADSEEDMTAWVRNLCGACDLKQEESPTDIPPEQQQTQQQTSNLSGTSPPTVSANGNAHHIAPNAHHIATSQPVSISASLKTPPAPTNVSTSPSYIPLNTCRSGSQKQRQTLPKYERRESVDSVPEEVAPPPPDKGGKSLGVRESQEDSVFSEVYDVPPNHNADELYQVPPRRPYGSGQMEDFSHGLAYDVPPRRGSPSTPRSSGSDKASMGRPVTPQDLQPTYDTPPPRPTSSGSGSGSGSQPDQTPPRPPRPATMNQTVYMNVPKNSKSFNNLDLSAVPSAPKPPERPAPLDSYDIPRSGSIGSRVTSLNVAPPPPKSCSTRNVHKYMNAAEGVMQAPKTDSAYVPMDKSDSTVETVYTDMDVVYTDMKMSDMRMSERMSSLYQSPPPCRIPPRTNSSSVVRAPPCPNPGHNHKHQHRHPHHMPHHHHLPQHLCADSETYENQIWSSTRTKSFKRNEQNRINNHSSPSNARKSASVSKPILQLPSKYDTVSSSDEEEDADGGIHLPRGMRAVPPPPQVQEDKELKYLDLELDEYTQETNTRSPSSVHLPHSTPTEYREIDFVKTQALSNTKKWKDEHMHH